MALEVGAELYVHARSVLSIRRMSIVSICVHLRVEFNLRATCFVACWARSANENIYLQGAYIYMRTVSESEHSTLRLSLSRGS